MPCYVFTFGEDGRAALLYFDGLTLRRLLPPGESHPNPNVTFGWGKDREGQMATALTLAQHCDCPGDILGAVAERLIRTFVRTVPNGPQTIPDWIVSAAGVRAAMAVLNDLNGN